MEISSIIVDRALGGVNELALPVVGVSCAFSMLRTHLVATATAPRRRRGRPRLLRRGVSLLGLLLTVPSPAAAGRRHPPATSPAALEVRTEPGGFPPPRLPGSAGPPPPWVVDGPRPGARVHPAVHGGARTEADGPLFGRWKTAPPAEAAAADTPPASAQVRPDRGPGAVRPRWHAVLPGETLWSIAAERLETDDVRRIARYWPRIHRANRDEIGPDPNLIRPGQVLELPPEHA